MTWSVYLGSDFNNPEGIEIIGQFVNGDVTLFKGVKSLFSNLCKGPFTYAIVLRSLFLLGLYISIYCNFGECCEGVP